MRITDRSMLHDSLHNIQRNQERLQETTNKASSGIQIDRPSDDPVAYSDIAARDVLLTRLEGYNRNISLVRGRLGATESNLQSVQGVLVRLRELTLVSLNGVTTTDALTMEAEDLTAQLIGMTNQSFSGDYLYNGYSAGAPFSGAVFVGDNAKRAVEVSPLGATTFGVNAQDAFGVTTGQEVFKGISDAVAGMRSGNHAAVAAGLDAVDKHLGLVATAMASVGAQQNTLSTAERANQDYALELRKAQGLQRDIDPAKVYSQLTADQYAVQATFAVLGSSSRLSLIKYL
jgi:flagellar hook-associated protein 3 FlgL